MSAPSPAPSSLGLPAAAQPDHLTAVLRRSGVLGEARVREVTAEPPRDMVLSRILRLKLAYDGAAKEAPASLILKARLPGAPGLATWGTREASFYATVAPATPDGLVPRCFDASAGGEGHDWYLLLEDLSDSHRIATRWPLPPSEAECRAMVGVLARFQAAWWDDPRLGVSIGAWTGEAEVAKYLTYFEGCFRRLCDRLGDALSAERRALYERYFAAAPFAKHRFDGRRNLSIVHGDAHVWNVFLPNDGAGNPLLFDWDAWRLGLTATDLAYMMALHWYPERRRRFERPLLDHYHATLIACGVTGYDRHALDEDYRLAVVMAMMIPLVQADNNLPAPIWWGHLERIMLAVDDLGGRELLGG